MAYVLPQDRVRETTTDTGTGTITLSATSDYRRFSDVAAVGDTVDYAIILGPAWEVGIGTIGASNTLARAPKASSNAGAAVFFGAGVKDVFMDVASHVIAAMLRTDIAQALNASQQAQARANAGVPGVNVLINSDFRINQRVYGSGATLAAGSYGHDRWKAGAGGGNYSFTQLASSTQVTIAAGKSIVQIVEDKNVVGGSYVLSWSGTAQARVGVNTGTPSGSYASSPIVVTGQTAGTIMSVEFNAGTLGMAKMEAGSLATPFVMQEFERELSRCQRYFEKSYNLADAPGTATLSGMCQLSVNVAGANSYGIPVLYATRKRTIPSITLYDGAGNAGKCSTSAGDNQAADAATISGESGFLGRDITAATTGYIRFHFTASAEL